MNQLVQPVRVEVNQALMLEAQWIQAVMGVIMTVWMGVFVLSQVKKVIKGEEVEKPPMVVGK